MLGRPAGSSRASVADGFHDRDAVEGKRRKVMGEVALNTPVKRNWTKVEGQDGREGSTFDMPGRRKPIPLFMPSPSPPKNNLPRNTRPVVSDADQSIRDLLEGLDDPDLGLFDDVLDSPTKKPTAPTPGAGQPKEELKGEEMVLTMHEWMNVGADEATPKTEVQEDLIVKEEDGESEYADDFDYDAIDLDVLATMTPDLDPADQYPKQIETKPGISTYPIPHPPIHDSRSDKYMPVPWARCIVESVSLAPSASNARFHSGGKVVLCRIVESVGSSVVGVSNSQESGMRLRCTLKGEWAELVLAGGKGTCCIDSFLADEDLCNVGDIVNIISPVLAPTSHNTASPSDKVLDLEFSYASPDNFLIAHPDILFPMTSLAGAVGCRRKPLVMDLIKTTGGGYVAILSLSQLPRLTGSS